MTVHLLKMRGVPYTLLNQLLGHGIHCSDQLLEITRTPAGRMQLSQQFGLDDGVCLELANRADLARIKGIGGVFAVLLGQASINTVQQLAAQNPDQLYRTLVEINNHSKTAGRNPTFNAVKNWVAYAKTLPPVIE